MFACLSCQSQKQIVITPDANISEDKLSNFILVDESLSIDGFSEGKRVLEIDNQGRYQYIQDTTLFEGTLRIALLKDLNNDTGPKTYGYLTGRIEKGKKEGEWKKEIIVEKGDNFKYTTVKLLNYSKGVLNGKYQVFNLNGEVLSPNTVRPLYPETYKNYTLFENGTGFYYDYYYDSGVLKETGYYRNGKKQNDWVIYDKIGKAIKRERYYNGVIINE